MTAVPTRAANSAASIPDGAGWTVALRDLNSRWSAIQPAPVDALTLEVWSAGVTRMTEQMNGLRREGRWSRGPDDLLSIVGLQRWELAHSSALAWLCDPYAAHGLGSTFLDKLIALSGPALKTDELVETAVEVSRAESRADVIIRGSDWTLIIEVKVDASEGPRQAERLYSDWVEEGDSRFLFLTRRGVPPTSATGIAQQVWVPVSWGFVRSTLRGLISTAAPNARGRDALQQYAMTLESTF